MTRPAARLMLGILILHLAAGCSSADSSGGPSLTNTQARSVASSEEPDASACDPMPDMPVGRIVYTQVRQDGDTALFLMRPDGSDQRCLIDTAGPDASPAWSPNGRWVAFQGGNAEQEDLFKVRADGTGLRQLTDTPEWEEKPVWSPDGRRIAYSRSHNRDEPPWTIRVMSADGSADVPILSSGHGIDWAQMGDWSPDGRTLLIATDNGGGLDLVRVDPDGTDLRRLPSAAGDFGSGAVYSPDGRWIAFQSDHNGGCIYRSDPAARRLVRLTQGCSTGVTLTWSPDSQQILWAGTEGGSDLESMLQDGSQRRTIVDSGDVAHPDWQPPTTN